MPQEIKLSEKVTGKVGFPDGHMEVAVKLPWPIGSQTLRIEADELDDAKRLIDAAVECRDRLRATKPV
jgi:hypothetical protein